MFCIWLLRLAAPQKIVLSLSSALGVGDFGIFTKNHQHSAADRFFLNFVLVRMSNLSVLIELGAASGVTLLFLGLAARARGIEFHTYDMYDQRGDEVMRAWLPNMHYHSGDCHQNPQLEAMLGEPNVFLYIDADKLAEVRLFVPKLRPGSVFLVHDWYRHVMPWQIEATLEAKGVYMLHDDVAEAVRSELRFFFVAGQNMTGITLPGGSSSLENMYKRNS